MAQEQPTPQPWYERALTIDYFAVSRTFWTNLLETVRFYITKLADELVEIVSRGIMLMTPMPNAISMYKTAMKQLGWSWYEALPFSLMIEFIVFFLIEIALLMLTRWLAGRGNVYRWMFGVMVTVVIFGTGGVMWLVNQLEPHKIMTILPAFSLLGFIAIGLRRWDARNEEVLAVKRYKVIRPKVESLPESPVNHLDSDDESILSHYLTHPLDSERNAATALGMSQSKVNRKLKRLESIRKIHRNGNGVEIIGA